MSAFIVEPETIGIVARVVCNESERTYPEKMTNLVNALWEMNERAVDDRYGAQPFGPYIRPDVRVPGITSSDMRSPFGSLPKGRAFRATSCYLYQCSEGDVPELPLYRRVKDALNRLAHSIAHDVTEEAFKDAWK